jgi:hypothetical protein
MLEFLRILVTFLSAANIIPPEVQDADVDREKTYLMHLPDDPDNIVMVREYESNLPTLVNKTAGVRRIQFIIRNANHEQCIIQAEKIFNFLKNRPELIEDLSSSCWVIFDIRKGPVKLDDDERGRVLYSLSLPITTNF